MHECWGKSLATATCKQFWWLRKFLYRDNTPIEGKKERSKRVIVYYHHYYHYYSPLLYLAFYEMDMCTPTFVLLFCSDLPSVMPCL